MRRRRRPAPCPYRRTVTTALTVPARDATSERATACQPAANNLHHPAPQASASVGSTAILAPILAASEGQDGVRAHPVVCV